MYATLDEALTDIAQRSFYEDATVRRTDDGYEVDDDHGRGDESYPWTYDGGAEYPAEVVDHSRLHESYEFYDEARHVRYNLSAAVAMIEEGTPITFKYVTLDAPCEDSEPCDDDHLAGWALIAFDASPEPSPATTCHGCADPEQHPHAFDCPQA